MDETEAALEAERENSRRLRAALILTRGAFNEVNGDHHLHAIIGPAAAQVTLGQIIDGTLALDAAMVRE